MVRRRELARVHPGVLVDHTGPLTGEQRRWAAVLSCWPAALSHQSAVSDPADERLVHLVVDRGRHLSGPPGVRVHRLQDFDARVLWHRSPPRLRTEDAVLLSASAAGSAMTAVAGVADACGAGSTTAGRLRDRLGELPRLRRRHWLETVLADVALGMCSVLEHGYLTRVERAHGLPPGRRQVSARVGDRASWLDVRYDDAGVVVELDGRLHHGSSTQRATALRRDLVAAAGRCDETLRLDFQQVFDTPCPTAGLVGAVLRRRGWPGTLRPCGMCG